jgi:hypothetical protein
MLAVLSESNMEALKLACERFKADVRSAKFFIVTHSTVAAQQGILSQRVSNVLSIAITSGVPQNAIYLAENLRGFSNWGDNRIDVIVAAADDAK